MKRNAILSVILTASLCGCGTIASKRKGDWGSPYTGTQCSTALFTGITFMVPLGFLVSPVLAADIPLSMAADTIVLPFDLTTAKKDGHQYGCGLH